MKRRDKPGTVADVVAEGLAARGIRHVFGLPGGETIPLIEALRQRDVTFVLGKHEVFAGFMAEAYGLATGRPGIVATTRGPGATNLVTAVAHAWLDRSPLIAITGSGADGPEVPFPHETLDLHALYKPITKWSATLVPTDADAMLEEALDLATAEPPGPVHLTLSGEHAEAEVERLSPDNTGEQRTPAPAASPQAMESLIRCIRAARRPVIMAGASVVRSGASAALTHLATHRRIPVAVTMKAKGVFPETDPLFLGTVGFNTNQERKIGQLFRESDLVLLIGYDPVEVLPPWQRVLYGVETLAAVDQAPARQHYPGLAVEVVGDVTAILSQLLEEVGAGGHAPEHDTHPAGRAAEVGAVTAGGNGLLSVAEAFHALQAGCPEETLLCVDVGSHKVGVSSLWISRKPGYIRVSNGLSAMGYALPAAIGAALALPGAPVAALMGDGGFYMMGFEIETALRLGVSLVAVVLCDGLYHRIQMKQADRGYPAVGVDFAVPDVVGVARALGAVAHRVVDPRDFTQAVRQGFDRHTVTVLEVRIDPTGYLAL